MSDSNTSFVSMRAAGWLVFYVLILLAWWAVFRMGGGDMGAMDARFATVFAMWALMMVAMMLPTIVPTLSSYWHLPAGAGASAGGWWGVVIGYGLVWLIGAGVFAALQLVAARSGLVDMAGVVTSPWSAAALFAMAGAWQFTRAKEMCQDACLSPMGYFMANWRPGPVGGVRMGVDVGLACVGCCWAIMALAFVGGVMSLLWMGLATLFMVAEKLPEIGVPLRRPAGVALLGAALFMAARGFGWI